MTITQEQIAEIAETVWSSFLGISLHALNDSDISTADEGHSASATVHISGSWNGSVILSCSTTLARKAAAAMFEIAEADLEDGEVADAFGELVNIVGGNLKCLLPEPSQLSLPTVSLGATHIVSVPGAEILEHIEMECDGDRLHIAVWNRREGQRSLHHPEHAEHAELERAAR